MHPTTSYRQTSVTKHPPYGLFLDPHKGRHYWTAVSPYLLFGIISVVAGAAALLALVVH